MFPVFYDLRPSTGNEMKSDPEMFGPTGNSENSGNDSDYKEVTAFPVQVDYWEPGNRAIGVTESEASDVSQGLR
jgi:hypothetical protein